jgi:hypothetical protein
MITRKLFLSITIILSFLITSQAYSQEITSVDSLQNLNSSPSRFKPQFHYSVGSSFTYIPRYGSVTGLTFSPYLSYLVSPKVSIEAGIIAGRYYSSLKNILPEPGIKNSFNALSVYGSARYQLNERLSVYGIGQKQFFGSMPLYTNPTTSFTFGSTLTFGNFSVGAAIRMSDWSNNAYSPFGGSHSYFPSNPW